MNREQPQVLIVTGMSGAGRSTAANVLEDLGYTVIDNLPPGLIAQAVEHHQDSESRRRVAVVADSRGGVTASQIRTELDALLGQGIRTSVLFLDAEDDEIVKRYEENRRPHPFRSGALSDAIVAEREWLADLRDLADTVVDTTELNVHQLRDRIHDRFAEGTPERPMRVSVTSFGFKHGIPRDSDLMFDVRFLPNPHWVPELRAFRGTDEAVSRYVFGFDEANVFLKQIEDMLEFLIPRFQTEGKSYLSIAIGCTGGHHRSVAFVEALGAWLDDRGIDAVIRHRDAAR